MKRKSNAICLLLMLVVTACAGRKEYNDGYIKYGPLEISQTDKEILLEKSGSVTRNMTRKAAC